MSRSSVITAADVFVPSLVVAQMKKDREVFDTAPVVGHDDRRFTVLFGCGYVYVRGTSAPIFLKNLGDVVEAVCEDAIALVVEALQMLASVNTP